MFQVIYGRVLALLLTATLGSLGGCTGINHQSVGSYEEPPSKKQSFALWEGNEQWHYSDGYAMRVEYVDKNDGCTRFQRLDSLGDWHEQIGPFRQNSLTKNSLRQNLFRNPDPLGGLEPMFSLEPGLELQMVQEYLVMEEIDPTTYAKGRYCIKDLSQVRFQSSKTIQQKLTVKVGRQLEKVSVPVGSCNTWLIEMTMENPKTGWKGRELWWYCPEVRNYVRMEYQYGDRFEGSRVLVSCSIPGTSSCLPKL